MRFNRALDDLVLLMNASCPHLKFDSSIEIRLGWRATNLAVFVHAKAAWAAAVRGEIYISL
jgi:hypothetical protein